MTTVATDPARNVDGSKFSISDQTNKQTKSRPNLHDLGLLKGCCRDFSTTLLSPAGACAVSPGAAVTALKMMILLLQ